MTAGTTSIVQNAKRLVRDFHHALEVNPVGKDVQTVLDKYTTGSNYVFRGVYPFRELVGSTAVAERVWTPLQASFPRLQRRPDIFIGGMSSIEADDCDGVWVLSMGHFMGLFDKDWLGIRATRKLASLRYAEFSLVQESKIVQTGFFVDIVGFMQSVGMNPLPPSTGSYFCYPGPRTHDGLHYQATDPEEGIKTQALVDRMIDDLSSINHSFGCDPKVLQRTWHDDMIWYGPAGIGATSTIDRYQEQHQLPFRSQLADKKFHGHQCRIAEGNYAAFFGWPLNLTNRPLGGFCGMPGGTADCPMQVVDVYRRDGDNLAENWVFIDMLWYFKHQGLDILERTTGIMNPIGTSSLKQSSKGQLSSKRSNDGLADVSTVPTKVRRVDAVRVVSAEEEA